MINKIDLAPYVGASLEVMDRDATLARSGRPFIFCNLRAEDGLAEIQAWFLPLLDDNSARLALGADGRIKYAPDAHAIASHRAIHSH